MVDASFPPSPERPDTILDAAFHAFATYGYRRTTMDDIAKGAGLSRSALYLHFRNKEDILRSLANRYFDEAHRDMIAAINQPNLTMEQSLLAAFMAKDGKFMQAVLTTPHGQELMDAGFSITGDLVKAGEARLVDALADWLARRNIPAGLGSAREVAETIITAVKGLKTSARDLEEYRAGQARLAALFARALG